MSNPIRPLRGPISSALRRAAAACLLSALLVSPTAGQTPSDNELTVRALELYRLGNCKEAEPLFEKVLLHQPKNIELRKLLGRCLLQDKRIDEARSQFKRVLDAAPDDVEALKLLRTAIAEIQKREQVKQTLALESRAATEEQFRSTHEMRKADELIKAHRWADAEPILEGIARRNPAWIPARQRLAEIYSSTKRFDQAAEVYRFLVEKQGPSSVFLLRLAQNLEWGGNHSEAVKNYRLYLKNKPEDLTALVALANILNWLEHYDEAAPYYRLYLEKRPDDLDARRSLANLLMWSGRYKEAIPELERVASGRPQDLKAQLDLAQSLEQISETERALKVYDRILEFEPTHPAARAARAKYAQFLDQLPRQKAFAALDRRDYALAAKFFADYLQKHPDSSDTVLQIARVYSWGRLFPEAEKYYEDYLGRAPKDLDARREAAQMDMGTQNYTAARKHYQALIESPAASTQDYESLVHSYTWAGDFEGAEPFARKLAALDTANPVASEALRELSERRRLAARSRAEELAVAGRFGEAIEAYRRYMSTYGKTPLLELLIARLYSWDKDYAHAIPAYRDYLRLHPQDLAARLELANVENWSARYDEAEADYRAVLKAEPRNAAAALGLAQVMDRRGDDPLKVLRRFQQVLTVDAKNTVAQARVKEIHSLVAPKVGYTQNSFADSDGLYRSVNSLEATFSFSRRIKVTPYYTFGYFHQLRFPPGTAPQVAALNQKIADLRGTILANGGGGRFEIFSSSRWSWAGELGTVRYDTDRSSVNGLAQVSFRPGQKGTMGLTYLHRDAIYDVSTGASLAAGIMGDTVLLSYQQPLGERFRVWISGGGTRYTRGTDSRFSSDTQRRLSARFDVQVRPSVSLGYALRLSSFISPSPLFFSPSLYQTHGLAYGLSHGVSSKVRVSAEGEVSYGRIDGVDTFELALVPSITLQVHPDLALKLAARFSRGRSSSFGAPVYRTLGGDFSLVKAF